MTSLLSDHVTLVKYCNSLSVRVMVTRFWTVALVRQDDDDVITLRSRDFEKSLKLPISQDSVAKSGSNDHKKTLIKFRII